MRLTFALLLGLGLLSSQSDAQLGPTLLIKKKAAPTVVYRSESFNSTSQATYTFAAQDIGLNPGPTRLVIVLVAGVSYDTTGTRTITSFSINGIPADVAGTQSGSLLTTTGTSTDYRSFVAIGSAIVPTGTTGDVVLSVSGGNGTLRNCRIRVYEAVNGSIALARTDSDSSTANGQTSVTASFNSTAAAVRDGNTILAVAEKGGTSNAATFTSTLTTVSSLNHISTVDSSFGEGFSLSAGTKTVTYGPGVDARAALAAVLIK